MTDTNARNALRARQRAGTSWADIAHATNLMAGDRIVSDDTVRRFAAETERTTRRATVYWIVRYLEAQDEPASESAAVSR